LLRIGANDPEFNLRRDPAFMIRRRDSADTLFVNILEPHGSYNAVTEQAKAASSSIAELKVLSQSLDYTSISIKTTSGARSLFLLASNSDPKQSHELQIDGNNITWVGPYHLMELAKP